MKNNLIKFFLVGLLLIMLSGMGSANSALTWNSTLGGYEVWNWTDLNNMRLNLSENYILMDNLSSSTLDYSGIGDNWQPIGNFTNKFSGNFNGSGNTISNLTISRRGVNYIGLFGGASGGISNIGLINVSVTGSASVGALVGYFSGIINNSYSVGVVIGTTNVGGLVGSSSSGTIIDSYSSVIVTGSGNSVGGLVGVQSSGTTTNSYSTGTVTGSGTSVGGIIGFQEFGIITNSYSTGNVVGSSWDVGGFVGLSKGIIINSYSTGNVTGGVGVGGLVGEQFSGSINNSYSVGNVLGSGTIGGLVGLKQAAGAINNSFWDVNTSGKTVMCGSGTGCTNTNGKTTIEMKKMAPFFFGGWNISQGVDLNNGYPYLAWQVNNNSYVWLMPAENLFVGGNGSLVNPYQINSWIGLDAMRYGLTANYVLVENLSSSDANYSEIGNNWQPIGNNFFSFVGNFNGSGNTISNLTISKSGIEYIGLFGVISGNIYNVCLINVNVTGGVGVGGLAGYSFGIISNSYATGKVTGSGQSVGGLVGSSFGIINNSYFVGNVTSFSYVGGLAGYSLGVIANSYSVAIVTGVGDSVGGLIGILQAAGSINNSYSIGNVTGSGYYTGGLVGDSLGSINNSYSTGNVNGSFYVGGLAGSSFTIGNSYSTGNVAGFMDYVGGLVGSSSGSINNSYSRGNVTGSGNYIGGLVGSSSGSINNSYSRGNVISFSYDVYSVGGLAGGSFGTITNSYSTGNIMGSSDLVGGLVGAAEGSINNSYSTGNVSGSSYVGGLVGGLSSYSTINNSYSTGNVNGSASYVGGLVGYNVGQVVNSFVRISDNSILKASFSSIGLIVGFNDVQHGAVCVSSYGTIFDLNYGEITFLDCNVTISEGGNLTQFIYLNNNYAYVNSSKEGLNKSANITFYNLESRLNPYILKDGISVCNTTTSPTCYNFTSLNEGNVTFNVSSWSNYSIRDRMTLSDVSHSPDSLDDIDPETNVTFNVSILNSPDFEIESIIIQIYKNEISWQNISLENLTNTDWINLTLLDIDEANYTYNVWVNNSLGEIVQSINYSLNATWDCSFIISPADGDLGTIGGFNQQKTLGFVQINNTGDFGYSDGCSIKFARTASGGIWETDNAYSLNFSGSYLGISSDDFPDQVRGLRYYNQSNSITSLVLGPKENVSLEISAIFPYYDGVITEYPYFPIFANITDTVDGETNKTIKAKMVITPGAYLETKITEFIENIPLSVGNYTFLAYVKNVVSGADNPNNTAYNVSFNWTLPSEILERSSYSNLTYFNESLNDTSNYYLNFTLALNSSNIESMNKSAQDIYIYASGYENSTGNLSPISQGTNGLIYDSISLLFSCVNESDGICVTSCKTNYLLTFGLYFGSDDSDCGYCGDGFQNKNPGEGETCTNCIADFPEGCPLVPGSGGSSGGGGGGGAGGSFDKSEATFELVRGEASEFYLTLENKLSSPKKDITVRVSGDNSQYFSVPSTIDLISPNSKKNLTVKITAPSYFPVGQYLIKFDFSGTIAGNSTSPFTETKYVTLRILEISRKDADELLNSSEYYILEMNNSGFITKDVNELLTQINAKYNSSDFGAVRDLSKSLEDIYNAAIESNKTIAALTVSIAEAEKNGIQVSETKKLLYLSQILFNRGDYILALEKLKEANLTYNLETKGEFKILYAIKNNPLESLAILISFCIVGTGSAILVRLKLLKRKLKLLAEEEMVLLELMKVIQRDCFQKGTLSMEEYVEAMNQYEIRLSEAVRDKIETESLVANLMRMNGRANALQQEKQRLMILLKSAQDDYLNKGQIDTRVYEGMLRAYATRVNKIDEELVFLEAKEQLGRFNVKLPRLRK